MLFIIEKVHDRVSTAITDAIQVISLKRLYHELGLESLSDDVHF